jgi:hypothetical protein
MWFKSTRVDNLRDPFAANYMQHKYIDFHLSPILWVLPFEVPSWWLHDGLAWLMVEY